MRKPSSLTAEIQAAKDACKKNREASKELREVQKELAEALKKRQKP